ncbi:unnamed protein product [Tetraodon nigroviridis]|uniref:(spotted green pufferfish) hypothetical protein n=1 Tax=Tetraodon nigroviridis TaxID=99883 RepID=Q4RX23_TETNG|nr:unnamed protein product [Tetraodon nigroviridis]
METPLEVLSRAASFVHANEEDGRFDESAALGLLCVSVSGGFWFFLSAQSVQKLQHEQNN